MPQVLPALLAALDAAPLTPHDENPIGAEWLDVLLLLLRSGRVPIACLERHVVPWAERAGEVSSAVGRRLLCAHAYGALAAARPPSGWVERHYLSHALTMCQDTEHVVRAAMCAALHEIGGAVGPTVASREPLSEWLELTDDEHPQVRAASFECGVALLASVAPERRAAGEHPLPGGGGRARGVQPPVRRG